VLLYHSLIANRDITVTFVMNVLSGMTKIRHYMIKVKWLKWNAIHVTQNRLSMDGLLKSIPTMDLSV